MDFENISKVQELKEKLDKIDSMYNLFTSQESFVRKTKFKVREDWSLKAKFSQKKFKSEDFDEFLNLDGIIKKAIAESLGRARVKIIDKIKEL